MRYVVVGGGIAGLTAAYSLVHQHRVPGTEVLLLESSDRVGGCLRSVVLAGQVLDAGADAILTRRAEGVELLESLGLRKEMIAPATGRAYLAWQDRLHPYPTGLFLGVPVREEGVREADLLSEDGRARALQGFDIPATTDTADVSVAEVVGRRWGAEVADRLAGPLIAAVHAGRADYLSAAACAPQLFPDGRPATPGAGVEAGSPFVSIRGGLWQMADALRDALLVAGVQVRTGERVLGLDRQGPGWVVAVGSGVLSAECVVLAVGPAAAAGLLAPSVPAAAAALATIESASVAIATVLLPPSTRFPDGSGFLVPADRSRSGLLTACTWFDQKWPDRTRADGRVVRLSTGRHGDERFAQLDDAAVAERLTGELGELIGRDLEIESAEVTRFTKAFPQYAVGHLERVARIQGDIRSGTAGTLALCGNAYEGVGLPAVIASARTAIGAITSGS